MKMSQYQHSWPPIKNNTIKVLVLTPLRMTILQYLVFDPVMFFFKSAIVFSVLDLLWRYFDSYTFYTYLRHLEPIWVYSYIAGVFILMIFEFNSRFWASRHFCGLCLKICFKDDAVEITKGIRKRRYSRQYSINFAFRSLESAVHPVYKKSQKFQIVIDDNHTITLAEIYDLHLVERLVENCNFANTQMQRQQGIEIDPRTARA